MVGVPELLGGFAFGLLGVSGYLWNGSRNIWSNYGDGFDEMKTHRASIFRSELNDIVLTVLGEVDHESLNPGDEPTREVVTMDAIEKKVSRSSLTDIEEALRDYDEPNELLDEIERTYSAALKRLITCVGMTVVMAITLAVFPENAQAHAGVVILGFILAVFLIEAVQKFYSGHETEQQLDRMIRDYKDDY